MVGERLAELRKDKELKQAELADMLTVSVHTIKSYEQGKSEPTHETLTKIAKIFNISCDFLLGLTDEEVPLNQEYRLVLPRDLTRDSVADLNDYIKYLQFRQSL